MRQIERERFNGSPLEFGLYLKGEIVDGELVVSTDVMLPPQYVTGATIDFDADEDGGDEFNGVIHRHPGSMHSFSGTDESHINANFMFSLLYASKEIKTGVINIPTEYGRIRMDLDIYVDTPEVDISHLDLDNIKERVVVKTVPKAPSRPSCGYNWQNGEDYHPTVAHGNGFRGSMSNGSFTPPGLGDDDDNDDDKEDESLDTTVIYSPEDVKKLNEALKDFDVTWEALELYAESNNCTAAFAFNHLTGFEVEDVLDDDVKIDEDGYPYLVCTD